MTSTMETRGLGTVGVGTDLCMGVGARLVNVGSDMEKRDVVMTMTMAMMINLVLPMNHLQENKTHKKYYNILHLTDTTSSIQISAEY